MGLELNQNRVILASKINHLKNLRFQTANLTGNIKKTFDVILAVDLLHHLSKSDQMKFFIDASKLTKSGKLLIIKDINRKFVFGYFWNFVHDLLIPRSFQLNYLTSETIIGTAKITGFSLMETHHLDNFFIPTSSMSLKNNKFFHLLPLFFIFILAFSLRTFDLNWDSGYHLHPDERFLTMVISAIKLPQNIFQYFDTSSSPLNPYNYPDYQFFVYGTFPIFLVKLISHLFIADTYESVYLFGRVLSALFDSVNIFVLYIFIKINFPKLFPPLLFTRYYLCPVSITHSVISFFCRRHFSLYSAFTHFPFSVTLVI